MHRSHKYYILLSLVFCFSLGGYSQDKVKNVILLIGDGMGVAHVNAGIIESSESLNLERAHFVGLSKTCSKSDLITDSGAGATAMSSGEKTYNGAIGIGMDGDTLKTILEYAEEAEMSVGLVSTSAITHATPASFISHNSDRNNYEEIAVDFLRTPIDIFIGGGRDHFEKREDGLNLSDSLRNNGYQVVYSMGQLKKKSSMNQNKRIACLTADLHMPSINKGRSETFLSSATRKSIHALSKNDQGFFLMVEGSQIDWGGHDNDASYVITEMFDFDKAIGVAFDFADRNPGTLVIITADHETGGLTLNESGNDKEPLELKFSTTHHTAVMVPVFAYGTGAEKFSGIYENTEIFFKMMKALGIEPNSEDKGHAVKPLTISNSLGLN